MANDPRDDAVDHLNAEMVAFAGAQPDKKEISASPHVHPTENWVCVRLLHHHGKRIVVGCLVLDGLKLVKHMSPTWLTDDFCWDPLTAPDATVWKKQRIFPCEVIIPK